MSYLSDFKYDVFLSYAHKDNETTNDAQQGWMSEFYRYFKLQLDRYLDGANSAEIWCDFELRKNIAFNDEIRRVIKNSAIFLAFTSNSYYRSEYCCDKELSFFHTSALQGPIGLKIENANRLFQIQLLNKPHSQWPKEFEGVGCYRMFKYSNDNSLYKENDQGITLSTKLQSQEYEDRMIEIVQDVCNTLKLIKVKEAQSPRVQPAKQTKVFMGKVSPTLLSLREQIAKELEASQISIFKCQLPPPYDKGEHDKLVSEAISDAQLSVHLFDEVGGDKIALDYPHSFLQQQALLSIALKKDQLIFIPQGLDFEKIEDESQRQFLTDLIRKKDPGSKYNVIREFSIPIITEQIKTKLLTPPPAPANNFVLLDFNEVDIKYAVEFYNSLAVNKKVFLTTPGKSPIDFIESFDEGLRNVEAVIIVWYQVTKEWIQQRITEIVCAIKTGKSKISKLSIYRDAELKDLDLTTLILTT